MKRTLAALALLFLGLAAAFAGDKREIDVALDHVTQISVNGQNLRIAVHDNGSETISVILGNSRLKFQKASGSDLKNDNLTLIYTSGTTRVYYVNAARARQNMCILRVESD